MKIAIIGSRTIDSIEIKDFIHDDITAIISGGAVGVDCIVKEYTKALGIEYIEILPEYNRFGKVAPIKRNESIAEQADKVIAFWDGKSKGTEYTINYCRKIKKPCEVIRVT